MATSCQHSDWDTGWETDVSWFDFWKVQEISLFLLGSVLTASGLHLMGREGAFLVDRVAGGVGLCIRVHLVSSLMNGTAL